MNEAILKRLEVLRERIYNEIGDKKYCKTCAEVDWTIEHFFGDPSDPLKYSKEWEESYVPVLLFTCQTCGEKAIKEIIKAGPQSFHYLD